jgi:tyrosinase
MTTEETTLGLTDIQHLLEESASGNPAAYGGLSLWTFTRDQLLAAELGGLPLISIAPPKKSCCSGAVCAAVSSLLLGLRGEQPFDGSQFPRLPWGKAPMSDGDIQRIADWIADGVPGTEAAGRQYTLKGRDWTKHSELQELKSGTAVELLETYAEFEGSGNEYRHQKGELRQRLNIDCMTPAQIAKLRAAFEQLYALNDWPEDSRSYNNMALIHQNHCQHGWERFLPWHRIYLYEMEQVIQEFYPDVTMPYWDWTMPQYRPSHPDKGAILPAALKAFLTQVSLDFLNKHGIPADDLTPMLGKRYPNQTVFFNDVKKYIDEKYTRGDYRCRFIDALLAANSLWYPLRYSGQFNGSTINKTIHYHYPTADDIAQIMSLRTFRDFGGGSSYDDAFGFLDQNPHNTMHIWTGGINPDYSQPEADAAVLDRNQSVRVAGRRFHKKSDLYSQPQRGDMFSNLTASYDPVFWSIHVNIDRLWHEWQLANPNSNPVELDSVLTPWSYTVRDTLEMKRFGYEYVRSSCLMPVGAESPVARFVSKPIDVEENTRSVFRSAEVRLHHVPQLPRSCFVRVFLNLPNADVNTPLDHHNYAGYFAVFGHGDCIGGPGHCAVPVRGKFDLRPRSHNTPRNYRVDVTKAARRLFDDGATQLSITLLVVGADYEEDRELLRMDGVSLNFLD